ncbi:MAG: hypothetical protein JRH08_02350 [Deltaproteobacteria bacterium]|nr:hypothetical protein [Deltaproteobacteria bacterium]MBW1929792.1 hypothetical protein [Deltaproteobacteria bacterium]MBW2024438.1 hypothetical protein [Deltaproteobacteria bacterium]MBW2124540.1 hypothetical protein [Deltaproteobacteria bacterium]RLB24372.1 MAG: hypothetical protein DRG76_01660 [Deltaproteobacteria bacterium]
MQHNGLPHGMVERRSEPRKTLDQYYSVEFFIEGLEVPYQFRIWNMASKSMCVLVKEGSHILSLLKVGDKLNMKYYLGDSMAGAEYRPTAIRHITKDDNGRFKGHYLVGLEILAGEEETDKEKLKN